jgi:uncharacterized hydantoinase/oxoprolinase family protein
VCAIVPEKTAAELFATTLDVYTVLGHLPENPADCDTADGRPATIECAKARLARMLGGDRETIYDSFVTDLAVRAHDRIVHTLIDSVRNAYYSQQSPPPELQTVIVSGAGEFLARQIADLAMECGPVKRILSLRDELGPTVSACAPAYALAVLASERRP